MSGIQSIDIGVGDLVWAWADVGDRETRIVGEVLGWRDPWHIEIELLEDPEDPYWEDNWDGDWADDDEPGTVIVRARGCSIMKRASEWKSRRRSVVRS